MDSSENLWLHMVRLSIGLISKRQSNDQTLDLVCIFVLEARFKTNQHHFSCIIYQIIN